MEPEDQSKNEVIDTKNFKRKCQGTIIINIKQLENSIEVDL